MASIGQIKPAQSTPYADASPVNAGAVHHGFFWPGVTPPPSPKYSSQLQHAASAALHLALQMPADANEVVHVSREGGTRGYSCHSCKTSYPREDLMFCQSGNAGVLAHGGGNRKCRKKSCNTCLTLHHGSSIALQAQTPGDWWCFACRGECPCAGCSKPAKRKIPRMADFIKLQEDYNALAQDSATKRAALQQQVVILQQGYLALADDSATKQNGLQQRVINLHQQVVDLQQQVKTLQGQLEGAQFESELYRETASAHSPAKRQRIDGPMLAFFEPGTAPLAPVAQPEQPLLSSFTFASSAGFASRAGSHFTASQSLTLGCAAASSESNSRYDRLPCRPPA